MPPPESFSAFRVPPLVGRLIGVPRKPSAAPLPPTAGSLPARRLRMSVVQAENNLTRASREWISRPDDERYLSLDDLYEAVCGRANESRVLTVPNRSLVVRGSELAGGNLTLEQEDVGILDPTHWSLD